MSETVMSDCTRSGSRTDLASALALLLLLAPAVALASDGAGPQGAPAPGGYAEGALWVDSEGWDSPTYYESVVDGYATSELMSTGATGSGLPTSFELREEDASLSYSATGYGPGQIEWTVRIEDFARPHERVDAVYDMVLALPLPATPAGHDAFHALDGDIPVEVAGAGGWEPLVYGGEEIRLQRNVSLENAWLAEIAGGAPGEARLPALDGTGYRWTLWDTIVQYDPGHGSAVEGRAEFRYVADWRISEPDPHDERLAAYVITWIPSLPASVPPFAVRIDAVAP